MCTLTVHEMPCPELPPPPPIYFSIPITMTKGVFWGVQVSTEYQLFYLWYQTLGMGDCPINHREVRHTLTHVKREFAVPSCTRVKDATLQGTRVGPQKYRWLAHSRSSRHNFEVCSAQEVPAHTPHMAHVHTFNNSITCRKQNLRFFLTRMHNYMDTIVDKNRKS